MQESLARVSWGRFPCCSEPTPGYQLPTLPGWTGLGAIRGQVVAHRLTAIAQLAYTYRVHGVQLSTTYTVPIQHLSDTYTTPSQHPANA